MTFDFNYDHGRADSSCMKFNRYLGKDILPLWVADMDFAVSPSIIEAVKQRLEHPVLGYTEPSEQLNQVVIEHLQKKYNWQVKSEWLVWLPGVVPGLSLSCRMLSTALGGVGTHKSNVVTNVSVYHHFLHVAQDEGLELRKVPLLLEDESGRWVMDFDAIETAIDDNTRLFMLCNPHNPGGTVFREHELKRLTDICAAHNVILVSDEIHCDLLMDESLSHVPIGVAAPDYQHQMITLMAPTKTFNIAGLGSAFAVIPDATIRAQFIRSSYGIVAQQNALSYAAVEAAFSHGQPWLDELLIYLRGNLAHLHTTIGTLDGVHMPHLEATYLAWIDVGALGLQKPAAHFEKYGLGLSPGSQFGNHQYVRLNFATQRQFIDEAAQRFSHAVNVLNR